MCLDSRTLGKAKRSGNWPLGDMIRWKTWMSGGRKYLMLWYSQMGIILFLSYAPSFIVVWSETSADINLGTLCWRIRGIHRALSQKDPAFKIIPFITPLQKQKSSNNWQLSLWPRYNTFPTFTSLSTNLPVSKNALTMGRLNSTSWGSLEANHYQVPQIWDNWICRRDIPRKGENRCGDILHRIPAFLSFLECKKEPRRRTLLVQEEKTPKLIQTHPFYQFPNTCNRRAAPCSYFSQFRISSGLPRPPLGREEPDSTTIQRRNGKMGREQRYR